MIEADLVVDATGRSSKMTAWLQSAGFGTVPEEAINSGLGYGTRTYKIPDGWETKHVSCTPLPTEAVHDASSIQQYTASYCVLYPCQVGSNDSMTMA